MQIRWNPPADAHAIESIFSSFDNEDSAADKSLEQPMQSPNYPDTQAETPNDKGADAPKKIQSMP